MPNVRFPATGKEFTAQQLADGSAQIPTQVYIILLNDSETVSSDSAALIGAFKSAFGDWEHKSMFSGKIISGTLEQAQVVWLLGNGTALIKVIEADGQVSID
eukprot:COSAG01_NODE_2574_length_7434_cov_6.745467_2_plen_102_part_00